MKSEYEFWRVSNIQNRRADQFYRSVGNLIFKAKSGEVSDNPAYGFSESHFDSDSFPGNAFDGLDSTYTLSSSLEDGTNTEEHGKSWWVGYKFSNPVELESIDISMRFDMEGVVDNITDNSLGQEWTSFEIEGSDDGVTWSTVYFCNETRIFKNDTSFHKYNTIFKDPLEIKAKYWSVTNISCTIPTSSKTLSIINFNSNLDYNIIDTFASSVANDNYNQTRAFDNSPSTITHSAYTNITPEFNLSWRLGFQSDIDINVTSINLQMRQDMDVTWKQEWQSADIEYSLDGITWHSYGSINPNIPHMDLTLHQNIPINFSILNTLGYVPPVITDSKYKFWRVGNLNIDVKTLDSTLKTSASDIKFINDENLEITNLENTFCYLGSDPHLAFDDDITTKSVSVSHFIIVQDYTIGCMFDTPVNVNSFKYIYNIDSDLSKWISGNIEYSYNGFDWFIKGYCDFSIGSDSEIFPILNFQEEELKHKFWKLDNFVSPESQGINFNSLSLASGLRFNTLGGETSNNPEIDNYSYGLFHPDYYETPSNSFDTALNIPVNFRFDYALTKHGQNDYYTFVLQEKASVKIYSASGFDTYGYLYDSQKKQINANDDSGGNRQFLMTNTLNPGRYYIMVRAYSASTTGDYSLIIQTNSDEINSTTDKSIVYEFKNKEYVKSVRYAANKYPMYCSLKSSDDGVTWNFEGYLNFNNGVLIGSLNHFELFRDSTNFFDHFGNTNLGFIENYSFKESLITISSKYLDPNITNLNIYNPDSNGVLKGQVTELDIPVIREVAVYERRTRQLIAITWSDEKGQYKFTGLDSTRKYYVHAIDSNDFYNAVTQDMIEPLI